MQMFHWIQDYVTVMQLFHWIQDYETVMFSCDSMFHVIGIKVSSHNCRMWRQQES
jgi:hypothetical protein